MSSPFGAGTLVEYAGARWRVLRMLGVETVLLRSDTGEEVAADPLKLQQPATTAPVPSPVLTINELRYSQADWAEVTRHRDLLRTLAAAPSRTTADVAGAVAALGLIPAPGLGVAAPITLAGR